VLLPWLGVMVLHHGLNKASLFLACGCAPGRSWLRGLLVAIPALAISAAPLTTGMLAKTGLKTALAEAGVAHGWTLALSLTSTATALLLWHFWRLVRSERGYKTAHPAWLAMVARRACRALGLGAGPRPRPAPAVGVVAGDLAAGACRSAGLAQGGACAAMEGRSAGRRSGGVDGRRRPAGRPGAGPVGRGRRRTVAEPVPGARAHDPGTAVDGAEDHRATGRRIPDPRAGWPALVGHATDLISIYA